MRAAQRKVVGQGLSAIALRSTSALTWLAQRPKVQGPVITLLALFQGLFFFLFIHQYPIF